LAGFDLLARWKWRSTCRRTGKILRRRSGQGAPVVLFSAAIPSKADGACERAVAILLGQIIRRARLHRFGLHPSGDLWDRRSNGGTAKTFWYFASRQMSSRLRSGRRPYELNRVDPVMIDRLATKPHTGREAAEVLVRIPSILTKAVIRKIRERLELP